MLIRPALMQEKYGWCVPATRNKLNAAQLTMIRTQFAALAQEGTTATTQDPDLALQTEQTARLIEGVGWMAPRSSSQGGSQQQHATPVLLSQRMSADGGPADHVSCKFWHQMIVQYANGNDT